MQLGRRSGAAAKMGRPQEVEAWRQAALGRTAAACEELVLAWEFALVEAGTVLLALGLASAWALVEMGTVLPALGSASLAALVKVVAVKAVEENSPGVALEDSRWWEDPPGPE